MEHDDLGAPAVPPAKLEAEDLDAFKKELNDLERQAYTEGLKQQKRGRYMSFVGTCLLLVSGTLSAVASYTALSADRERLGGLLALGAAIISTVLASLRPAESASRAKSQSAKFFALCHDTRLFRDLDLRFSTFDQARVKLGELWERFTNMGMPSPLDEAVTPSDKK